MVRVISHLKLKEGFQFQWESDIGFLAFSVTSVIFSLILITNCPLICSVINGRQDISNIPLSTFLPRKTMNIFKPKRILQPYIVSQQLCSICLAHCGPKQNRLRPCHKTYSSLSSVDINVFLKEACFMLSSTALLFYPIDLCMDRHSPFKGEPALKFHLSLLCIQF